MQPNHQTPDAVHRTIYLTSKQVQLSYLQRIPNHRAKPKKRWVAPKTTGRCFEQIHSVLSTRLLERGGRVSDLTISARLLRLAPN
jgi:hypothetical protein